MGIQGLLPFLDKSSRPVNISQFKGLCAAIDAYCWLHKGAYTCAEKLARGEACDAYVHYCMKYVNMLLSHNIKPVLVFDGRHLPAKAGTEKKRRESREANRKRGAELLRAGRADEARNFLRRCVDVTHEMALNLIRECRRRNVDCIVAPYEADAQLAYLELKGVVQVVVTEDSDLVLFGCKKVMFKMDLHGNGILVERDRLHMAMGTRPENFNFDKFRYMCILSGCDYLPSLPGIGLAKACKFITKVSDPDIHRALARLPLFLNMRQLPMTTEYRDDFLRADATFRHQLVYDPISRAMLPLTPPPSDYKQADFAGKQLPADVAYQLALGNLDPFSLRQMDTFDPDTSRQCQGGRTLAWEQKAVATHPSVWSKGFKIRPPAPTPDPRALHRPTTQGREVNLDVLVRKSFTLALPDTSPSDTNLASLYGDNSGANPCGEKSPEPKRRRLSSQSPIMSGSVKVHDSPGNPSPPIENLPSMSPIIGRKARNPFFKKSAVKPKTLSFDTDDPKDRFSALAKFGQMRRSGDGQTIVHSRYFKKTVTVEEPLHDISNLATLHDTTVIEPKTSDLSVEVSKPACESLEVTRDSQVTAVTSSLVNLVHEDIEGKTSQVSPSEDVAVDPRPNQRRATQTFKWGSGLQERFRFNGRRCLSLGSNAASNRSFLPHETDLIGRLVVEEEVDDPGVPTGSQGSDERAPEPRRPQATLRKAPRRVGLSKMANMKRTDAQQQSLLSMFGFQSKTTKFQYRQTL